VREPDLTFHLLSVGRAQHQAPEPGGVDEGHLVQIHLDEARTVVTQNLDNGLLESSRADRIDPPGRQAGCPRPRCLNHAFVVPRAVPDRQL
jgi:hypothetical protein